MRRSVALLVLTMATAARAAKPIPVVVGEIPEMDACTSLAVVASKNALTLRTGPGNNYAKVIDLKHGEYVHLCSTSADGNWSGVVLAQDGILDCQVTSPVQTPKPYDGPCISGWLPTKWLKPVAG
jgi:uncharacterized protein YgiM (DUF1202 family)